MPTTLAPERVYSAVSAQQTRTLVTRAGRPMATDVSVQIAVSPEQADRAATAADACMDWFDEIDKRLSRFKPESDLSRMNAASGDWFAASDVLFDAVAVAVAAAQASDGLFDPTLLCQLEALGYDRDFAQIAQRETVHDETARPAMAGDTPVLRAVWREIALDPIRRRVKLPAGVRLDLGGIAKGWAADVALERYCAAFPGALLNVGGDLRAHGGPLPGEPWSVGVRDPRFELADEGMTPHDYPAVLTFSRGGLATSGAVRRWWLLNGQRQHHLLDPRTGQPMRLWIDAEDSTLPDAPRAERLLATATALAPTAARAEVAAKMALLRGYPQALNAVEAAWERYGAIGPETDADAGVALALTFGDGEVLFSKNMQAYLATWGTAGACLPMNIYPNYAHQALVQKGA